MPSLKAATATFVLATLTAGALLSGAASTAAPSPQNLEVLAFSENFEGVLGARGWSFGDQNPANGVDFWGASTARAAEGNGSAYSAAVGDRVSVVDLWKSDFENGTAGWSFTDRNNSDTSGLDYWGRTTYKSHNGTASIWCAQVGTNAYSGQTTTNNSQLHLYDTYMNATAVINTSLSAYADVQIEYWFWQNSENSWDNLYVAWFDGSWHFENQRFPNMGGSLGWQMATYRIPTNALQVGFLFTSDPSIDYEGAYVDDVRIFATRVDQNRDLRMYDDNMDAQFTHDIDVSYFDTARIEYRYFMDAQLNDTLSVMISDGLTWSFIDAHAGVSGGWGASSVAIPIGTRTVGFRFTSDGSGRSEGAYVDEFNVWGSVLPVSCTATAYETSGMEVVTPFHLAGSATGGLRPYSWAWVFGDGTTKSGGTTSDQNPIHSFPEVSVYTPVLTVTDSLGQTCNAPTAPITVGHDVSSVLVNPASARLTEGTSVTVYGFDGQGHPHDLDWELMFPECGVLSTTHGSVVIVTSATDAGGTTCTVTGAVGSARSSMRLTVTQDTSIIHITPPEAIVVEGHGLRVAATDRYGGELPFLWTTTCGRVGGSAASFTLFEAVIEGGVVCTITASFGGDIASSVITVVHDTANIDVSPKSVSLLEGAEQSFSARDGYGHPFEAEWSVDPASCGSFSLLTGASTTFRAAIDAGGTDCDVIVAYGVDHREVGVAVQHDLRDASVTPTSSSLQAGASVVFRFGDANGHPFSSLWSVSPGGCGVFEPAEGASTTLTVSGDFAGYTCTVSATGIGFTRFASVLVEYGAPTTLVVTPTSEVVEPDGQVLVTVAVKDAAGHTIPSIAVGWSTTTCGEVSPSSGVSTTLSAPKSAAGSRCTVTATMEGLTGSAEVRVNHVGPFTVRVSPATPSLSGGQAQVFSASVVDGAGAPVPDALVVWSSTCGVLSNSTGASVTFVAPADVAQQNCQVTASASAGGVAYQSVAKIEAGGSSMLLILLGIAAAGGVAGLVAFRMRGRKAAPALDAPAGAPTEYAPESAVSPAEAPAEAAPEAPASPTMACPKCGATVEVGWTACPECGNDLSLS